jgi:predicted nucleic acid-binding protein
MHLAAIRALEILMKKEETLVVALQNIAEFWNAATRPAANNGLGLTIDEAQAELTRLEAFFQVLTENTASYAAWKNSLIAQRVSGVQAHDARIASVMKAYGVTRIVTFNVADFARYPDIDAVHPETIA